MNYVFILCSFKFPFKTLHKRYHPVRAPPVKFGPGVARLATLRINDSVRDAAAEMTRWLQKGTAKYAAVLDTAGSIEAVLTAKPAHPAFKHSIKTISDWWSVEKQMKNWFDGSGHDFSIQIKHKCDGVTVAELKSQGKDVSLSFAGKYPLPRAGILHVSEILIIEPTPRSSPRSLP
jgi:hypothetical protein